MSEATCSTPGCVSTPYGRGLCKRHRREGIARGEYRPRLVGVTIEERFAAYVDSSAGPDGCWPWTRSCGGRGYGQVNIGGRIVTTHRLAYAIHVGTIPAGMHVLHRCDNRPCCNPAHLFLGTNADNNADKVAKGRQPRGEAVAGAVLTEAEARRVLELAGSGRTARSVATEYGLSASTITAIWRGEHWAHLLPGVANQPVRPRTNSYELAGHRLRARRARLR